MGRILASLKYRMLDLIFVSLRGVRSVGSVVMVNVGVVLVVAVFLSIVRLDKRTVYQVVIAVIGFGLIIGGIISNAISTDQWCL